MREIKFRAWHKRDKVMSHEWRYSIHFNGQIYTRGGLNITDHFEIMQYTGLKDKNGKEIYEGDVMASSWDTMLRNWVIEFHDGSFTHRNIMKGYEGERFKSSQNSYSERIVIGNIYENPELLTQ